MRFVADTHVLVWWLSEPERLPPAIAAALATVSAAAPLAVPDIVLWEIATLVSLGRLTPALPLEEWLTLATSPPLVTSIAISPAIAAEVAALPDTFHRDPGDRIIVATARVLNLPLLTIDRRIRDSGLVRLVG
ncbi:twitching motility protein PilT [Deltaproteobacteria bacterium]|nr:twitching motility protein PilT [Deltaproteobacteria bacterium]